MTTNKNDGVCAHCGRPLVRFPIGNYYRLQCDNAEARCPLFHEGQGNIPKDGHIAIGVPREVIAARRYLAGNLARKERVRL